MLTELQQRIVNAPYDRVAVNAAAASGKTTVLIEKIRQILRSNINPREVAAITFTNLAAAEIKSRLGDDYKEGMFIGTIHSLANQMLLRAGIHTGAILDKEKFDELFPMIKKNPQCVWHIEWLLLDEAQDSDGRQFEFIFRMINPRCFFIVGDIRQTIYRWKGSVPELFGDLAQRNDVKVFSLNQNFRCGSNILAYAKKKLWGSGMYDDSVAMREGGEVLFPEFTKANMLKLIGTYGNYKDWVILTRTNEQIKTLMAMLKNSNIPCATFKQGELTRDKLIELMNSNTVKILTVHSAKGLEWPYVMLYGLYTDRTDIETYNVNYVAATRAKDMLVVFGKRKYNEFKFE